MDDTVRDLRGAAFDLFSTARGAAEYEVAYHALCAALHAAESLEDPASCRQVEERAKECRAWLEAHAPEHKLSTQSARSRGHESIYRQLEVTAEAARLRLELLKKQGRPKAPLTGAKS